MPETISASVDAPPGALLLKMQETSPDGGVSTRVLRISARRCAIGSDSTCNLRIQSESARPLDCLILRGRARNIVRRWSPELLLAGQEPCDEVLTPGQRFEVGGAAFEVLESDSLPEGSEQAIVDVQDEPGASLRELTLRNWQTSTRLQQGCALNRARARRLIATLRSCQVELQDLKQQLARRVQRFEDRDDATAAPEVQPAGAISETTDDDEQAEDLCFEEIRSEAPVTASALLNSLGVKLADDEADDDPSERIAARLAPAARPQGSQAERSVPSTMGAPAAAQSQPPAAEDDESVENYMARLLQRVRQKADETQPASYQPVTASPAVEPAPVPSITEVVSDRPAPLTELPARRSGQREEPVNLSAMRELAHMHAQSVLDIHSRRRFQRNTMSQIGVIAGAAVLGLVLTALSGRWSLCIYPAMISFAVALVWGAQYAMSMRQVAAALRELGIVQQSAPQDTTKSPTCEPVTEPCPAIEPATAGTDPAPEARG